MDTLNTKFTLSNQSAMARRLYPTRQFKGNERCVNYSLLSEQIYISGNYSIHTAINIINILFLISTSFLASVWFTLAFDNINLRFTDHTTLRNSDIDWIKYVWVYQMIRSETQHAPSYPCVGRKRITLHPDEWSISLNRKKNIFLPLHC